jgi:FACT complex subunit SPT16 N-terminal lobe domain
VVAEISRHSLPRPAHVHTSVKLLPPTLLIPLKTTLEQPERATDHGAPLPHAPAAMGEVNISAETFSKRLKLLYDAWRANRSTLWDNATALVIPVGASSDDLRYLKSISLHLWLFGYELPGAHADVGCGLAIVLVMLACCAIQLER